MLAYMRAGSPPLPPPSPAPQHRGKVENCQDPSSLEPTVPRLSPCSRRRVPRPNSHSGIQTSFCVLEEVFLGECLTTQ